jgi:hypothetical protein
MASPAPALSTLTTDVAKLDLSKTEDCVFITTHFTMGIGRMKQITNLNVITDADQSQLRHQKKLIDSPELEEIRSQDGFLKRYLDSKMCRYSESTGFLPHVFLKEVDRAIIAYQTIRRPKLVQKFMEKYRALEAMDFAPLKAALGSHFNRSDYPSSEIVERGFDFTFYYRPVGKVNLEGISDVIIAREAEKEQAIRLAAVTEWRDALRLAGAEMVDALFDMLKPEAGKTKKLYGCHVEKLQEFLATLPDRDLANDTDFTKNMNVVKAALEGVTIDRLRESKSLQQYVADKVATVREDIKNLTIVSGRRFR